EAPPANEPAPAPASPVDGTVAGAPLAGWVSRLRQGLSASSASLADSVTSIFTKRRLDSETLEELEDVLIRADLGAEVSGRIVKRITPNRYGREIGPEEVRQILADEIAKVLKPVEIALTFGN